MAIYRPLRTIGTALNKWACAGNLIPAGRIRCAVADAGIALIWMSRDFGYDNRTFAQRMRSGNEAWRAAFRTLFNLDEPYTPPTPEANGPTKKQQLIAAIQEWREETGHIGKGGVVICYWGEPQGWRDTLRNPEEWLQGCVAVDEAGQRWLAVGEDDDDNANEWYLIKEAA